MILFDTSVFVAAAQRGHQRHEESLSAIASTKSGKGCCAVHTLTEFYSVLTRMPRPQRLSPEEALRMVDLIRERMAIILLDVEEQHSVLREMAARGLSGGIVHDALILQCARKAGAKTIFTLNVRHFRMIAPDLTKRILEP